MTHDQLRDVIIKHVLPTRKRPMLWGPPGVGKTALVQQITDRLMDITQKQWALRCWDMTYLYDPADTRVIPTKHTMEDGKVVTRWVTPEHMVIGNQPTIILLDDLPTLPQSSQAACYRLLQHGEIGGTTFGPNVFFMGAGNRMGDNSATNSMPFALANRLSHYNLKFSVDGWAQWAMDNVVPLEVIAYHRFSRGVNLYPIYNSSETTAEDCGLCREKVQPNAICSHCVKRSRSLPTLRTWEEVGKLLKTNPDPDIEMELYAGEVGKEKASEFCGYLKVFRQLPSMESIIMGPSAAPIPKEPSAIFFVAAALGRMATPTNVDSIVEYLERLPQQEFAAVTIKDAIRRCPDIQHTRACMSWSMKHQDLMGADIN